MNLCATNLSQVTSPGLICTEYTTFVSRNKTTYLTGLRFAKTCKVGTGKGCDEVFQKILINVKNLIKCNIME